MLQRNFLSQLVVNPTRARGLETNHIAYHACTVVQAVV